MRPKHVLVITAVLCVVIGAAGCDTDERQPEYTSGPCPPDVRAVIIADVNCGFLTVLENRTHPRRSIRLLVTRIQPPPGTQPAEPVLRVGTDIAGVPNYAGTSPMAQRVGREVIVLDARGTAHSQPSLECPEVTALNERTLATATDDPAIRDAYLDAVATCHRRLSDTGIDLASYNVAEMAADAADLRVALGIKTWDVATSGSSSRIALEMLRTRPEGIRAVILDSPEVPGADPRATAVDGTRDALAAVLHACARDDACSASFPAVEGSLSAALAMLDSHPVTLNVRTNDRVLSVYVDGAMILRLLRHMLSDGGSTGSQFTPWAVPAFLHEVLAGRLTELAPGIAGAFVGDVPYCIGYQPKCLSPHRQAIGVAFSVLCHDIAPFADRAAPQQLAASMPGYAGAYGHSPYLDVCQRWPVGTGTASLIEPVRSDLPVLVAIGAFDPYVAEAQVRRSLIGLTHAAIIIDPAGGHTVIPLTPCTDDIRTQWLTNPTQRPHDACLRFQPFRWDLP
jgi:pimeloyl-ACP methyl ester carboxylesterase